MSGDSAPSDSRRERSAAGARGRRRTVETPTSVRPSAACENGSMPASGQPVVGVALRVPVAIEVVPELGVLPDARREGVGDLLRRPLDRVVARHDRGDEDRRAPAAARSGRARSAR